MAAAADGAVALIQRAIDEAIAAGQIRPIDPRIATEMLLGMLRGANRYREHARHARRDGRGGGRRVLARCWHARGAPVGKRCAETVNDRSRDSRVTVLGLSGALGDRGGAAAERRPSRSAWLLRLRIIRA